MGDVAKGIKAFKKGMSDDDADEKPAPRTVNRIEGQPAPDPAVSPATEKEKQG
jgi:sec-independent protein translocase protein TatA